MKRIYLVLSVAIAMLFFSSCSKNILDSVIKDPVIKITVFEPDIELTTVSFLRVFSPGAGIVFIHFDSDVNTKYTDRLTNLAGKELYAETIQANVGINKLILKCNNIPTDNYYFILSNGVATKSERFHIEWGK